MDLERSIAELYAQPLDEFVSARDRLAAELKAGGDVRASQVKALRKPGVPVWVVNRVAVEHPERFAELLAIGKRLREAHAELLAGGDPEGVRALAGEEREIVARLVGHAKTLLEAAEQKTSPATLERVGATLGGLATDPEAAEAARAGRLDREVARGGFGEPGSFETASVPADKREPGRAAGPTKAAVRRAREGAAKARRRADELARRADDLTRQAEELAAEVDKLARRAGEARKAAEVAAVEASEAEGDADRLEREAGTP